MIERERRSHKGCKRGGILSSSWRNSWYDDFGRVVDAMTEAERATVQRSGLLIAQGRRVFVQASARLQLEIGYTSYIMEQATRAFDGLPMARCASCGSRVATVHSL